jgi:hypothetical protein
MNLHISLWLTDSRDKSYYKRTLATIYLRMFGKIFSFEKDHKTVGICVSKDIYIK